LSAGLVLWGAVPCAGRRRLIRVPLGGSESREKGDMEMSFLKKVFGSRKKIPIEVLEKQAREESGLVRDQVIESLIRLQEFRAISQVQSVSSSVADVIVETLRNLSNDGWSSALSEALILVALQNNRLPQMLDLLQENHHKHPDSIAFYEQLSELVIRWFALRGGNLNDLIRALRYSYDGISVSTYTTGGYSEGENLLKKLVESFPETEISNDDYEALTKKWFFDKRFLRTTNLDNIRKILPNTVCT
jgi:hypothetical protein